MKIVEINGANYASTGNIMLNIAKEARLEGFEVFTCCKNSKKSNQFHYDNQLYIGTRLERIISEQLAQISGFEGSFNIIGTKKFINKLKEIKPDLIHLHIMHPSYINLSMFFKYLEESNIPVVWTFHDCWAFTGKCPHFERCNCGKWKTGCFKCPQVKTYPESYFFDRTKFLWNKKKDLFNSLKDLNIVTCSSWLKDYVKESYLKNNNIIVINNGIDLSNFRPLESDFRNNYDLLDKKILLGVAHVWSNKKGLEDIIKLYELLDDSYRIVIVGTNEKIENSLPNKIIPIRKTYNQEELAKIYSTADLFINPTYEDNFPTVNIEALACGTPVLTYDTGGSKEIIDEKCGSFVERGNLEAFKDEIIRICETKPYGKEDCLKRSKLFDKKIMAQNYIKLYKDILKK